MKIPSWTRFLTIYRVLLLPSIAAKDTEIRDLQRQTADQSQRLQAAQADDNRLDRIAKDLGKQKEKLQLQNSKMEDETV